MRAPLVRLAVLVVLVVLADACTCGGKGGGAPAPAASADPGPPRRGGVLTMGTHQVTTFDPIQAADYRKLEELANEEGPLIPLCIRAVASAARDDVHDITMLPNSESLRLWEAWKSP